MKIDQRLNIVIPVEVDQSTFYVYSSPIAREVFEEYFDVISKTFARIFGDGLGVIAGPRVAGLTLKKVAQEKGVWEGPTGVQAGLVSEIRRITQVMVPASGGWSNILLQEAVDQSIISQDDLSEVENALTFFIVSSAMLRKSDLRGVLNGAAKLCDAQITSQTSTEYVSSLQTSTEDASTGTKAEVASSVPS